MKSSNLPLVDIIQINESIGHPTAFPYDLVLEPFRQTTDNVDSNSTRIEEYQVSVRINGISVILVKKGTLTVSVDYVKHVIKENTLFFVIPDHILHTDSLSDDLEGAILVISKDFLSSTFKPHNNEDNSFHYMQVRQNPSVVMSNDEFGVFESLFYLIRRRAEAKNILFHKEIMQSLLLHFFYELKNIIFQKNDITPCVLSRKEELFQQFLKLLFKHNRENHEVSFYASELCITPQYLSSILKDLTGKTTNKWIDDSLILDAKTLLKAPNATVQQVSDTLNFSNQSTFGKFFKKHTGLSPAEYRKG